MPINYSKRRSNKAMSRFYVSAFNLNDIKNLLTVQLYIFKNVFEILYLLKLFHKTLFLLQNWLFLFVFFMLTMFISTVSRMKQLKNTE